MGPLFSVAMQLGEILFLTESSVSLENIKSMTHLLSVDFPKDPGIPLSWTSQWDPWSDFREVLGLCFYSARYLRGDGDVLLACWLCAPFQTSQTEMSEQQLHSILSQGRGEAIKTLSSSHLRKKLCRRCIWSPMSPWAPLPVPCCTELQANLLACSSLHHGFLRSIEAGGHWCSLSPFRNAFLPLRKEDAVPKMQNQSSMQEQLLNVVN